MMNEDAFLEAAYEDRNGGDVEPMYDEDYYDRRDIFCPDCDSYWEDCECTTCGDCGKYEEECECKMSRCELCKEPIDHCLGHGDVPRCEVCGNYVAAHNPWCREVAPPSTEIQIEETTK